MSTEISPLAPEQFPEMHPVAGVRLAAIEVGVRYEGRADVTLVDLAAGTTVAGVLTKSKAPGAPVDWCRKILPRGTARGLVVKAGNANVFTGDAGRIAVEETAAAAADLLGVEARDIYVASTGVIGEFLDHTIVTEQLPRAHNSLSETAWRDAADAILTTDTFAKGASRTARIGDATVTISGIAKGSGMIAPDMATMLSFVFTDAAIPAPVLQNLLVRNAEPTFNSITVDGDTSTSDTLLLFATGQAAEHPAPTSADDPVLAEFSAALHDVLHDLALQVVCDGEGAQKLIEIRVTGAESDAAARRMGLVVANSPLVKTAVAGEDANWGRVVMAVGRSGELADRDRMSVSFGGIAIARDGRPVEGYDEAPVTAHMKGRKVLIETSVGVGGGAWTVWTCDLTHGYISINADYRS